MRTFHRILRSIPGGGDSGELIDTSEWRYTHLFLDQHRIEAIDQTLAAKSPKCICGRRWVDKEYLATHQAHCQTITSGIAPTLTPDPEPVPAA
jgi:hypothetical protein